MPGGSLAVQEQVLLLGAGQASLRGFFRCRAVALGAAVAQGLAASWRAGSPDQRPDRVPRVSAFLTMGTWEVQNLGFSFLFMGVSSGSRMLGYRPCSQSIVGVSIISSEAPDLNGLRSGGAVVGG